MIELYYLLMVSSLIQLLVQIDSLKQVENYTPTNTELNPYIILSILVCGITLLLLACTQYLYLVKVINQYVPLFKCFQIWSIMMTSYPYGRLHFSENWIIVYNRYQDSYT